MPKEKNRIYPERKQQYIEDWKTWQQQGCCPRCEHKHIHIKAVEKWGLNNNALIPASTVRWWKYSCRSCSYIWFPITEKKSKSLVE